MGKWSSISDGGKNIIAFEENVNAPQLDTVALGMIINNNIPFIVPCSATVIDDAQILKFNISGYEKMVAFVSGCSDLNKIVALLSDICSTIREIGKYMMSVSNLIFDAERVYIDTANMKVRFLSDIEPSDKGSINFQSFFMELVVRTNLNGNNLKKLTDLIRRDGFRIDRFEDDLASVNEVNQPMSPISGNVSGYSTDIPQVNIAPPVDTPAENDKGDGLLRRLLSGKSKGKKEKNAPGHKEKNDSFMNGVVIPGDTAEKSNTDESAGKHITERPAVKKQHEIKINAWKPVGEMPNLPPKPREEPIIDDEATKFEGEDDAATQLESDYTAKLVNKRTGESVSITKDIFFIGRGTSGSNDLVLTKETVGRTHAVIMRKGDQYFIMDKNSKNHTYVNERQLIGNEEVPLKNGYSVKFSSEEFVFEYEG